MEFGKPVHGRVQQIHVCVRRLIPPFVGGWIFQAIVGAQIHDELSCRHAGGDWLQRFRMGEGEKDRVGLMCHRFWSQGLEGQWDQAATAWEHGANGRAGGFFRCDRDQFKMRMERNQADKFPLPA